MPQSEVQGKQQAQHSQKKRQRAADTAHAPVFAKGNKTTHRYFLAAGLIILSN